MAYGTQHVVYSPERIKLAALQPGEAYLEVWRGLPNLPFEATISRGGKPALRYERGGDYIYVTPTATEALAADPRTVLVPLLHKNSRAQVDAWWVDLPTPNLEARTLGLLIEKVRELNEKSFLQR